MHACERCYSRKTKCDRALPHCGSCLRSGSCCLYSNKRRNREIQREYLHSVELRLKELERENNRLRVEQVDARPREYGDSESLRHAVPPLLPTASQTSARDNTRMSQERRRGDSQPSPAQSNNTAQRPVNEESRYLGFSNGVGFVDVVERVVQPSQPIGGLFKRVADSHHGSATLVLPYASQSSGLVDQSVALPLIESYFDHWHIIFPLLYRPTFMQMVQDMYSDPHYYQTNAGCAFAFDIVLALGSVSSKRLESPLNSESHFVRALNHLDEVSSFRDIRTLQALLLYCEYGIHASLRDTSSEMWEVLGKATRLCIELGLHQDNPTVWTRCQTHIAGAVSESVRLEMQIRCFWCCYNLERIVNISLGRPMTLHDDDIHTPLPSTLDDDTLADPVMTTARTLQTLSPFVQHIRLRKIQSKIHRGMYTSRSIQGLSLHERQAVRNQLLGELNDWRSDLSLLPLSSRLRSREVSSPYLHSSWYQALFHSGCLLLFRPSATFPAIESFDNSEESDDALHMIWTSSRLVLVNYLELLRARRLNYSWVCLYAIFMAGLANIYSVGCCVQRRKRGIHAFLPSFWKVLSDVRDCTNILTAICERWDDARASYDVFDQLSTSALQELAAMFFQQNHQNSGSVNPIRRADEESGTTRRTTSLVDNGRQPRGADTNAVPFQDQYFSPSDLPDGSTASYMSRPLNALSDSDPIVNFQQTFQEMQDALVRVENQPDEVMLGLSQDWFGGRQFPFSGEVGSQRKDNI